MLAELFIANKFSEEYSAGFLLFFKPSLLSFMPFSTASGVSATIWAPDPQLIVCLLMCLHVLGVAGGGRKPPGLAGGLREP